VNEKGKEKFYLAVKKFLPLLKMEDIIPDIAGIRPKIQRPGEGFRKRGGVYYSHTWVKSRSQRMFFRDVKFPQRGNFTRLYYSFSLPRAIGRDRARSQ